MHIVHFSYPGLDEEFATWSHWERVKQKFWNYGIVEALSHESIATVISLACRVKKLDILQELVAGDGEYSWQEFKEDWSYLTRYRREALFSGNLTPRDISDLNQYQKTMGHPITADPVEALFAS